MPNSELQTPNGNPLAEFGDMTITRVVGVILILIGLVGVLFGGVFWTREKTVVDIGPIEAKTQEREGVPISPIVGGVVAVAGVLLLLVPARRRV